MFYKAANINKLIIFYRRHYDVFQLLLYVCALITKPLANSFSQISNGESLNYGLLFINIFCIFDIVLHFFFAYEITDTREIVFSRSKIARYSNIFFLIS